MLGRISRGAAVTFGATRDGWRETTLVGWMAASSLRNDSRDGFDVAVSIAVGAPVRTTPSDNAPVRATAVAGALFHRVETRGGWVHVRRTAWIPVSAVGEPVTGDGRQASPAPEPREGDGRQEATTPVIIADSGRVAIVPGSEFSAVRSGAVAGRLDAALPVEVVERRDGWSRVRVDVWVPDASLSGGVGVGPTGAELRADPDRYVGHTVEWRLQLLAVREADELRPELPRGQPYLLTRGPLPETGFVYVSIPSAEVAAYRSIPPLSEITVRATVRAGRSRFLPTPVLDLVRRLD